MASLTKTFTISWHKVTDTGALMLTFVPPSMDTVKSVKNSTAWRVMPFDSPTGVSDPITYQGNFGVGAVNIGATNNIVTTHISTQIALQNQTTLVVNNKVDSWADPTFDADIGPDMVLATNMTGQKKSMSIGIIDDQDNYQATFVWPSVGFKTSIKAKFHPTLLVYVTRDFQQDALITAELAVTDAISTINLATIPDNAKFQLNEDEQGAYTLKPLF